jgi:hypothetical protein
MSLTFSAGPNPLIFPVVMTIAGVQPQAPIALNQQLITLVTFGTDPTGAQVMQPNPGYTAGLPGSLIEDISSTDTASNVLMDQARVELINSMTPYGCNAFILNQLGQLKGVAPGETTNMSVPVIFSGTVNFIVQSGFLISDGTHTYVTQQAVTIGSGGASPTVTAIATQPGIWAIPAASVIDIVTSVDGSITLSVTNPSDGSGGTIVETEQEYRLRVLQAEIATCQGTAEFLKTLLMEIPGVVPTEVRILSVGGGGWQIVCGGSNPDPSQIAGAIFLGVPDPGVLQPAVLTVASITQANPGVMTTNTKHGYATGQVVSFTGVGGMTSLNTGTYPITVTGPNRFALTGLDTTGFPAYTTGGVVSPNLHNTSVTINDFPDNYVIPFITPFSQTTLIELTWNTASAFAAASTFNQQAQAAIVDYINSIPTGAPINILAMQEAVQAAVSNLLPLSQLVRMIWVVTIDGIVTAPLTGTYEILGDPLSYFNTTSAGVTVAQG